MRRDKIRGLWPLTAAGADMVDDIRKFEEVGTHPEANAPAIGEALTFHEAIGGARKEARLIYLRDTWAKRLLATKRVRLSTSLRPGPPRLSTGGVALVDVRFDANLTTSTYSTIFPFDTIALQVTGVDMTGRPYAIIHESSKDELVRFDPTFTTRETLYSYPTVPIALGQFAFGRGALRCDVLIAGFSIAHVTAGDTPAVP